MSLTHITILKVLDSVLLKKKLYKKLLIEDLVVQINKNPPSAVCCYIQLYVEQCCVYNQATGYRWRQGHTVGAELYRGTGPEELKGQEAVKMYNPGENCFISVPSFILRH